MTDNYAEILARIEGKLDKLLAGTSAGPTAASLAGTGPKTQPAAMTETDEWFSRIAPATDARLGLANAWFLGRDFAGYQHSSKDEANRRVNFLRALGVEPGWSEESDAFINEKVQANLRKLDLGLAEQLKGVDFRLIGYQTMVGAIPLADYPEVKNSSWALVAGPIFGPIFQQMRELKTIENLFALYVNERDTALYGGGPSGGATSTTTPPERDPVIGHGG